MKIAGSHFLITGANRGIGRAVAFAAAHHQANIHLVMRQADEDFSLALKNSGSPQVQTWIADLSTRKGVEDLVLRLKDQPIDILFNNAGQLTGGLIEEQPLDDIYSMFQVNVNAVVHLTRALLPGMIARGRGKIVNNSSVSALMHFPCASTYAASKAAVLAFTDCLELELKNTGVTTLSLVTPGIKTRMFDDIETKYAKNFEVPTDSISPEEYAKSILSSIENDDVYLMPKGMTAIGLWVARYWPSLFKSAAGRRFTR